MCTVKLFVCDLCHRIYSVNLTRCKPAMKDSLDESTQMDVLSFCWSQDRGCGGLEFEERVDMEEMCTQCENS